MICEKNGRNKRTSANFKRKKEKLKTEMKNWHGKCDIKKCTCTSVPAGHISAEGSVSGDVRVFACFMAGERENYENG